jgi:hypothetical protein
LIIAGLAARAFVENIACFADASSMVFIAEFGS